MCRVLQVHPSGFYAWVLVPECNRAKEDKAILQKIIDFWQDSHQTYGSPRIFKDLRQAGLVVGENRVARIMRINRIKVLRSYRKPRYRTSVPSRLFPNTLDRKFQVLQPNKAWVIDTTYVRTLQGWVFLTAVLDLYSRMIVGWSMRTNNHRDAVLDALYMAYKKRCPKSRVIIHSDQGSQFGSDDWKRLCDSLNLEPSMSRRGNCWDNAVIESFFSSLKKERIRDIAYNSIEDAKIDLFDYIEVFYNRKRRHSTIGGISPLDFELMNLAS
jgi:putative transposase